MCVYTMCYTQNVKNNKNNWKKLNVYMDNFKPESVL